MFIDTELQDIGLLHEDEVPSRYLENLPKQSLGLLRSPVYASPHRTQIEDDVERKYPCSHLKPILVIDTFIAPTTCAEFQATPLFPRMLQPSKE